MLNKGMPMLRFRLFFLCALLFCFSIAAPTDAGLLSASPSSEGKKPAVFEKVKPSFGIKWFRKDGYRDFFEPRVAFIKRKERFSEVIEYSWRPMEIFNMPHRERIDRVQCCYNRYWYNGPEKRIFFGGGFGGNIILFNQKLKDWAKANAKVNLKDGVNGLGRVFAGYKVSEFKFGKTVFPVVIRVDGFFSPPYKFGATIGRAGDQLKLTEVKADVALSIE